jgi:Lrp/AsnC family leucine-responsive transcriptional regulator
MAQCRCAGTGETAVTLPRLDRTDLTILSILQRDGRIPNAELAERVSLSASACLRRVQRLEAEGVLAGYSAVLDPPRVGLGLQAFVRVQLTRHDSASIEEFTGHVNGWDEVVACHALTGDMDYLLHVAVQDLEHFSRFLLDHLLNASGVADVNSSFVLRTVKQARALPLAHLAG